MTSDLKNKLISIAKDKYPASDPSHDFEHIFRVLNLAVEIAIEEKADLDVIIPAALFHDLVSYPKDDPRNKNATEESGVETRKILESITDYPQQKISQVQSAIETCSFSKGVKTDILENQILQDADGIEATGALAVMRTFTASGIMKRMFFDPHDPFAKNRELDDLKYSLDLFSTRLLKIIDRIHTNGAKKIAQRRTEFLNHFLEELKLELKESGYKA